MDENLKDRFTATAEGTTAISTPQCVGCKYNEGWMDCSALAQKPSEFVTNLEPCPMREEA